MLVLAFAALPAAGNFFGSLLAEVFPVSIRVLSLALHAAGGIVLGVVGLELFPEALEATPPWVPILAFVLGGVFFLGIDAASGYIMSLKGSSKADGPVGIFVSVALDLFSDGVMIGTGTVVNPALGLLLAVGQVPADMPEGFAVTASLKQASVKRATRIMLAASFAIPILIGATIGYFAFRNAPELLTLSVLALTGGALTSVVIEEVMTEAHEEEEPKYAVLFLVGGFALFALVATYFGG